MFRINHRVNFFLTFCTEAKKTKGEKHNFVEHFLIFTLWNNCKQHWCYTTMPTNSDSPCEMLRFQLKWNILPVPSTLLLFCLTLVLYTLSDIQKSAAKESLKLGKKLQYKSGAYFSLMNSVFAVSLKIEAYRLPSLFLWFCEFLLHFLVGSIVLIWLEYCELFWLQQLLLWVGYLGCRGDFCLGLSVHLGKHHCHQHVFEKQLLLFCEILSSSLKHQRGETLLN